MAETGRRRTRTRAKPDNMWAVGLALFAGVIMLLVGVYQGIAGFVALVENEFYVVASDYTFELDATTWGWIHLLLGALLVAAGLGVIAGQLWARVIGIVFAGLSAIANFAFIPYYPFWSIAIIALDVFIIWALCVYGSRAASRAGFNR